MANYTTGSGEKENLHSAQLDLEDFLKKLDGKKSGKRKNNYLNQDFFFTHTYDI